MQLPSSLLREFARVTDDRPTPKKETTLYGTFIEDNGNYFVRLDGSDILTPVAMAMDARNGDRVVVMIKNHEAVITGNISNPASAYTASTYIKVVDQDTLMLVGDKTVGIRSSSDDYRAEIAVSTEDEDDPIVQLQTFKKGDTSKRSIARLSLDGLNIVLPDGKKASVNGYEMLCTNNLLVAGQVIIKGNINANAVRKFSGTINNIPDGYALVGVSAVQAYSEPFNITSPQNFRVINFYTKTGIGDAGNAFEAWIENKTSTRQKIGVYAYWFGVKAASMIAQEPQIIDLPD